MTLVTRILAPLLIAPLLALTPTALTPVAGAATTRPAPVAERSVAFDVVNHAGLDLACTADGDEHVLRGTLVGPRPAVRGRDAVLRVNVLVHDAGTGGWFWHLRDRPAYDYAAKLAKAGETSLVLDRLGYGRSPLADGTATCLEAQATMLHQVVQSLYSGTYDAAGSRPAPQASHVVLHGHGTGATIVQLESAEHRDVQGVVLMSPVTTSPSQLALETLGEQSRTCLGGSTYAAFGDTDAQFRHLLFASAPAAVRRAAVARRSATPCGDVASLAAAVVKADNAELEGPVLRIFGRQDARRDGDVERGRDGVVTTKVLRGAGSALPLEKQAPKVRSLVLRFLDSLTGF